MVLLSLSVDCTTTSSRRCNLRRASFHPVRPNSCRMRRDNCRLNSGFAATQPGPSAHYFFAMHGNVCMFAADAHHVRASRSVNLTATQDDSIAAPHGNHSTGRSAMARRRAKRRAKRVVRRKVRRTRRAVRKTGRRARRVVRKAGRRRRRVARKVGRRAKRAVRKAGRRRRRAVRKVRRAVRKVRRRRRVRKAVAAMAGMEGGM